MKKLIESKLESILDLADDFSNTNPQFLNTKEIKLFLEINQKLNKIYKEYYPEFN